MKKSMMFTGFTIVAVLAVVMVVQVFAAGPSYQFTDSWIDHEVIDDLCDFPVIRHAEYIVKVKGWVDDDGDPYREFQSYGQSREVFYREGGERFLRSLVQGPVKLEMVTEDEILFNWNGPNSFVIVPGHGPAFGITGQLTITYNYTTQEVKLVKNTFPLMYDAEDL